MNTELDTSKPGWVYLAWIKECSDADLRGEARIQIGTNSNNLLRIDAVKSEMASRGMNYTEGLT